jgi:hypothetical protein
MWFCKELWAGSGLQKQYVTADDADLVSEQATQNL